MARWTIPVDAARRKFLFAFGVAFAGIGVSNVFSDPASAVRHIFTWTDPVPFWAISLLWILGGVTAIFASFGPTPRDKYGFIGLSVGPTAWAICYLIAGVIHIVDQGYYAPRWYVSVLVFGIIAFAIDTVSGMVSAELAHAAPVVTDNEA